MKGYKCLEKGVKANAWLSLESDEWMYDIYDDFCCHKFAEFKNNITGMTIRLPLKSEKQNNDNKCKFFKATESKKIGWFKTIQVDITDTFKKKYCKDCDYFYYQADIVSD